MTENEIQARIDDLDRSIIALQRKLTLHEDVISRLLGVMEDLTAWLEQSTQN